MGGSGGGGEDSAGRGGGILVVLLFGGLVIALPCLRVEQYFRRIRLLYPNSVRKCS